MNDRLLKRMILEAIQEVLGEGEEKSEDSESNAKEETEKLYNHIESIFRNKFKKQGNNIKYDGQFYPNLTINIGASIIDGEVKFHIHSKGRNSQGNIKTLVDEEVDNQQGVMKAIRATIKKNNYKL